MWLNKFKQLEIALSLPYILPTKEFFAKHPESIYSLKLCGQKAIMCGCDQELKLVRQGRRFFLFERTKYERRGPIAKCGRNEEVQQGCKSDRCSNTSWLVTLSARFGEFIVTYHIIAFFVLSDKKIVRPRPILLTKHIAYLIEYLYNLGYLHVIASEGHGKLFSWEIICFSDL